MESGIAFWYVNRTLTNEKGERESDMKKRTDRGFTLIEMIIAIAILVILTGLLAPQFMKYVEKSKEAKDLHTLDAIYTSVQAALGEEESYEFIESNSFYKDKIDGGITLESILNNADGSRAPGAAEEDPFAANLSAMVGGSSDLDLLSDKAKRNYGAKIMVTIDDEMNIWVYVGKAGNNYVKGLEIGTRPKGAKAIPTEKTS